ncbi:MAG: hypothetical protein IJT49_07875 [Clostridia bacterium]|nr:hypothetical protein [Clostridia bacterium]
MIKKSTVFILCLFMLLPLFAYAEQDSGEEIYFTADFDDNELPPGSDVTFGEDGFIFAEDGKLKLETSDVYPPVSTVLFPYENGADKYTYECDMTVNSSLSDGCWFSLCFGAVNENILYQFTVKCGAEAENSVSLQYKNGESSWKTVSSASLSGYIGTDGIDPGKFSGGTVRDGAGFRISVSVKDGMAFGCIDGVAVVEGALPVIRGGRTGISGRGVSLFADNVRISSRLPSWISAADSFSSKIYTPDSGIVEPPAVVARDRLSMTAFSENRQRPASVMMTVRLSGDKLHGYDGAVDLGELQTRVKAFADLALPAFYVSDEQSAEALYAFIEENGCGDCFVTVSKASLLDYFKGNKYLRTIVDMSSRDSVSASEISRLLYSNGCRTVMLSETAADAETVFELHKRLVTVWVNGTAGVDSLFDSAVSGADAVVTSEPAAILSVFEKVDDTVIMRRQVAVADETETSVTVRDVISALDAGVSAVRINILSVGENEAVMIGQNTLLEELFEAVYKEYPQSVFHINADGKSAFYAALSLLNEYEMADRCVILSEDPFVLKAASAEGMPAAFTGGPYAADGRGLTVALSSLCRVLNGYNSAYYAAPENMPEELISLMRSRGMYVCLAYFSGDAELPLISGCGAFTVVSPQRVSKLASSLEASADSDGRLSAGIRYCDGTEFDVTALCDIVTVSGEVKLADGAVTGSGVFAVLCPQTAEGGEKYSVCSKLIKIHDEEQETDAGTDTDKPDNKTLTTVIIIVSAAAAAAGVITLLYLTGKKRKNAKKQAE